MRKKDNLIVGGVATVIAVVMVKDCSRNRRISAVDEWQNAQGTQGFINLDGVRDAFRQNQSLYDFEKRVNEIYEGDNLVLFSAREVSKGFELKAYEDLDGDKNKSGGDDLLFTLGVRGRTAELKGAGVNSYYKSSWIYEPPADAVQQIHTTSHASFASSPFFWYWVLSPGWGSYYTPMRHYDDIYAYRSGYRSSQGYRDQVRRNTSFGSSMSSRYGSGFRNSMNNASSQRKSYVREKASSTGFKEKLAASRGKTGSAPRSQMRSSSSSRSGAFSGSSRSSSSRSSGFGGFRGSSGF